MGAFANAREQPLFGHGDHLLGQLVFFRAQRVEFSAHEHFELVGQCEPLLSQLGVLRADFEGMGDIPENTFQCIDGPQRLTAVRKFMAGEFTVFGGLSAQDLKGSPFDLGRYRLQMAVYQPS